MNISGAMKVETRNLLRSENVRKLIEPRGLYLFESGNIGHYLDNLKDQLSIMSEYNVFHANRERKTSLESMINVLEENDDTKKALINYVRLMRYDLYVNV